MKLPYCEGSWFSIPLRHGGFGVGLVARIAKKGKIFLGFYFGPNRSTSPKLSEVEKLTPQDAIGVYRTGDLALINGDWPIIGNATDWERTNWTVPFFYRHDEISRKIWKVVYSDSDPTIITKEEEISYEENSTLARDSVFGAGAIELLLTKTIESSGKLY
ncbi:MAG: hypothetical protein EOM59_20640 [Clostridia bacterium]|nr:hypothetical protein [Clostridia bacterium]